MKQSAAFIGNVLVLAACGARSELAGDESAIGGGGAGSGGASDGGGDACASSDPVTALAIDPAGARGSVIDSRVAPDGTIWITGVGEPYYRGCLNADRAGEGPSFLAHLSPELDVLFERRFERKYVVDDGQPVGFSMSTDGAGRPVVLLPPGRGVEDDFGRTRLGRYRDGELAWVELDWDPIWPALCVSEAGRIAITGGPDGTVQLYSPELTVERELRVTGMGLETRCTFVGESLLLAGPRGGPMLVDGEVVAEPAETEEAFALARFDSTGRFETIRTFALGVERIAVEADHESGMVVLSGQHDEQGTWGEFVANGHDAAFATKLDQELDPLWFTESEGGTVVTCVLGNEIGRVAPTPEGGLAFVMRVNSATTTLGGRSLSTGRYVAELGPDGNLRAVYSELPWINAIAFLDAGLVLMGGQDALPSQFPGQALPTDRDYGFLSAIARQ